MIFGSLLSVGYKRQRWDFYEEFTVWSFATNCAPVKFGKTSMSTNFSEERDLSYLHWFGHVTRMPQKRWARQVLLATPTGKQPRGRPRTRWCDYISDPAWSRLGVKPAKLSEITGNRQVLRQWWRRWGWKCTPKVLICLKIRSQKFRPFQTLMKLNFLLLNVWVKVYYVI